MKKLYLLITTIAIVAISACSKSDSSTPTAPSSPTFTGSFSAKVNGVAWSATAAWGTILKDYDLKAKRFDINATGPNNQRIILTLEDIITTDNVSIGEYKFDDNNHSAIFTYMAGNTNMHYPIEGKFVITECNTVNKTVKGTFEFKSFNMTNSSDTLKVTNGVFSDIKYQLLN